MANLLPFRDYDEKNVINLYAFSGISSGNKGTLVKIQGDGFQLDSTNPIEMLGSAGDFAPSNVVSQRYGVVPKMTYATNGSPVLGMTLWDIRETDENGEKLLYRPRKAAEMEVVLSGQACPVVTKGIFGYAGIQTGGGLTGVVSAGVNLYPGTNGVLSAQNLVTGTPIGKTLGKTDANGNTLIWLNV